MIRWRIALLAVVTLLSPLVSAAAQVTNDEPSEMRRDALRSYAMPSLDHVVPVTFEAELEVQPDGTVSHVNVRTKDDAWRAEIFQPSLSQWTFIPFRGTKPRWRVAKVIVEPWVDSETEHAEAHYESPLTLRITTFRPLVARFQRVNGKVPEQTCALHHEVMHIEEVDFTASGMPLPESERSPQEKLWEDAFVTLFPNSAMRVMNGCMVPRQPKAEAYVCNACRKARAEWLASHPDVYARW